MPNLLKLKKDYNDVVEEARQIIENAEKEDRGLTEEEETKHGDLLKKADDYRARIDRAEKMDGYGEIETNANENDNSETRTASDVVVGENRAESKPFDELGDFCLAVRNASVPGGTFDPRLEGRSAGTGNYAQKGSEGGFLLTPEFANGIIKRMYENNQVISRCRRRSISTGANTITFYGIDETSRADGSRFGGVRGYWTAELDQMTESRPKFRRIEFKPNKLTALYYASDEILEDAGILGQEVEDAFMSEIDFKIQDAIINGDGAGKPLGILNADALVSNGAESGQTATTLVYENIVNMYARMYAASWPNAVWFINQDIIPELMTMSLAVGTGGAPVYMPPGGASSAPYGSLLGKPIIPIEQCATLGTVGDIILADMSQYYLVDKGSARSASSIHLKFDYNQSVFRWIYYIDGRSIWSSALTPYKGSSNTQSPFVVTATRS